MFFLLLFLSKLFDYQQEEAVAEGIADSYLGNSYQDIDNIREGKHFHNLVGFAY